MDFKQLEVYVRVYELKSFSKAAEEVFLSQPSVSSYISILEKELETQLIYRSTKEFLPTIQGEIFYERAKDILALREKAICSIKDFSDCTTGNIDILASSVPTQNILPELLGVFHEQYPDITFSLKQADTAEVIKGISLHKGDLGFTGGKIENSNCVFEDFMSEKMVIIVPNKERFQGINQRDIPELLHKEHFIMRESGSGTRLFYDKFLHELGIKPNSLRVSAWFDNTLSIIQAVASGLGISIVSQLAAKNHLKQGSVISIEIDDLFPERNFYFVLKKGFPMTPTVDLFVSFIRSYTVNNNKYKP